MVWTFVLYCIWLSGDVAVDSIATREVEAGTGLV